MVSLRDGPPEGRHAVPEQHHAIGVGDEVLDRADIGFDVDVRRQVVGRLAVDERHVERKDPDFPEGPGAEEGNGLVVMDMDDRVDVGPEPENLAVEVVADTRHRLAVEQPACRDIGDDDVVRGHFLKGNFRMLGIGHAMLEVRMRLADHHVSERVVDIAAPRDHMRVAHEDGAELRIEFHPVAHPHSPPRRTPISHKFQGIERVFYCPSARATRCRSRCSGSRYRAMPRNTIAARPICCMSALLRLPIRR